MFVVVLLGYKNIMNRIYRTTLDFKGNTLQAGDIVTFTPHNSPIVSYLVRDQFLQNKESTNNLQIFTALGISPKLTGSRAYGYDPVANGGWPVCKFGDFEALTRLCFNLMSICETAPIVQKSFLHEYNQKRREEATGARLSDRAELIEIRVKSLGGNSATIQHGIRFNGVEYSMEQWEALKELHQRTRLVEPSNPQSLMPEITSLNEQNIALATVASKFSKTTIQKNEPNSIIVRTTPCTIARGQGHRRTPITCGGNATTIVKRKDSNQTRAVKS